jgi:CRISPR-associated protein Cas1
VTAKLEAQCAFLTERLPHEPMHRLQLRKAIDRLQHAMAALPIGATPGRLRGHEGAAAAAYFSGLQPLFAPSLKFTGRNRRPPRDPVNAVLSLGYTLLHAEAVLQAHAAGLDPYVGFLHDLDYGRESLACDFVEPLRPVVDGLALRLFRERTVEAAHFSSVQGACLMGKAGRTRFYEAWEPVAEHLRKQLQGHARNDPRTFSRSVCRALTKAAPGPCTGPGAPAASGQCPSASAAGGRRQRRGQRRH